MTTIYSWKTKKVNTGFQWFVVEITMRETMNSNGQYANTKIVKSGVLPTRAKAKNLAQKWTKYLKQTPSKK